MNRTRLCMIWVVFLLSLTLVGIALAADRNANFLLPQGETILLADPTTEIELNNVDSLPGSFVVFDPSMGGDSCYVPGTSQTFCFRAESFTGDEDWPGRVWEKFPLNWNVTSVYQQGTPTCSQGGTFGEFSYQKTTSYEVKINHLRMQNAYDHCTAYYCFNATPGPGTSDALVSWYWAGSGEGGGPYYPCSNDGYTPASEYNPCDEAVKPRAAVPACPLPEYILLVDDDNNAPDMRGYYTSALDYFGLTYDIWDTQGMDDEPFAADLKDYQAVIWFSGNNSSQYSGPGTSGETALASWLDYSGCLFLSSQEYSDDLSPSFGQNYLGVDDAANWFQNIITGTGSIYSGYGPYTLAHRFYDISDIIVPSANAEVAFNGDQGIAAVDLLGDTFFTTFLGFPFENLPTPASRVEVMASFLNACGEVPPPAPDIAIDPTQFETSLFQDQQTARLLEICNEGPVALALELTEVPHRPNNSVFINAMGSTDHSQTVELTLESVPSGGSPFSTIQSPQGSLTLELDDQIRDSDVGIGGNKEFIFLNRFTPDPSYFPFQLETVGVYFSSWSQVNVGDDFILAIYENVTGAADPAVGSALLASFPVTVQSVGGANYFVLPTPVTFYGPGDVLIGVIALEKPGTPYYPAAIDTTTSQRRSWIGWWNVSPPPEPPALPPDNTWALIADKGNPGNWMIRGYGSTIEPIPWLEESSQSQYLAHDQCAWIELTFKSAGLAPDAYSGDLKITSNDPDEPIITVPVTLTVQPPGIYLSPTELTSTGCKNSDVTYPMTLTNATGVDGVFNFDYNSNWPIEGPDTLAVTNLASASYELTVHIPCSETSNVATITATGNGYSDSLTLTTSVSKSLLKTWESISPINGPGRSRSAGASVDGKVYILGGQAQSGLVDTVDEYNPSTGIWTTKNTSLMPVPAANICAGVIGSDIYIPGGWIDASHILNTLQVYHVADNTWELITTDPLPIHLAAPGCAVVNNKLYVFGGLAPGFTFTNTTYVYDPGEPATQRWKQLSNMVYPRGYLAGIASDGEIYALGGHDFSATDLAYAEVFDPIVGEWKPITEMNTPRDGPGAWSWGNNLVVCGGGWIDYLDSCEMYDTIQGNAGDWINIPQKLITARRTFSYATLADGLYAVAGYNGSFLGLAERLLIFNCPGCPQIEVSPLSLTASQPPNTLSPQPVTICNSGDMNLTWSMNEFSASLQAFGGSMGSGDWLLTSEVDTPSQENDAGEVREHPSAYRWTPEIATSLNALVYADDFYHPAPNTFVDQALKYLGISYTAFYEGNWGGFISALTSGKAWDIVLVEDDRYMNPSWMTPLNTYIQNGGKAVVHTWTLDYYAENPLWDTMGVYSYTNLTDPPVPIYWWEPSHPFFNLPRSVPEFTSLVSGRHGIPGQYLEPLPGYKSLAGYTTPGPDPYQAALILGNNGRTVYKGFLDQPNDADLDNDGIKDGAELWTDLIHGVLYGIGGDIPWVTENPLHGTIEVGQCIPSPVLVNFDSTGLTCGSYSAALHINNNDPDEPIVTLPVTLKVTFQTFLPLTQRR